MIPPTTKCKRCNFEGVYWSQSSVTKKWIMYDNVSGKKHFCQDGNLKFVKCKYCPADNLHWAEEIDPNTQDKRAVLTESYGLPHSCDERIAFVAKAKQDKKDKYAAEKVRVAAEPNGPCTKCKGVGMLYEPIATTCDCCRGYGQFSDYTRTGMLTLMRHKLWPHMLNNLKP